MKKIFFLAALFMMLAVSLDANGQTDSLRTGRNCKVVLYNSFQAEGKIVNRASDTITLQTEITKLFIPVKEIKFVLNPEIQLSDLEETEELKKDEFIEAEKIDTTDKCDLYLNDKTMMSGVMLVKDTDSTIKVIKENRTKIQNISGIRKIAFKTTAPFGKGYLIGSLVGAGISFVTILLLSLGSAEVYQYIVYSALGSIPFGVIGGLLGEIFARDDIYLFESGNYPAKLKRIHYAMSKHY